LAAALGERLTGTNVEVTCVDATRSGLTSARFSGAACFTMLHHMPSPSDQDRLLCEVNRILRPGGLFIGSDSRDLEVIRAGHVGDTFVPVDPTTFPARLATAGFVDAVVDVEEHQIRFVAYKPPATR
jgi:SAM-dependent methyltransferase